MKKWIEVGSRFAVAGVQYSDYQQVPLELGRTVRFIGEPYNVFDPQAIRIEYNGTRIGYVPMRSQQQRLLWQKHNAGHTCCGVLTCVDINDRLIVVQALALAPARRVSKKRGDILFAAMRADLSYR